MMEGAAFVGLAATGTAAVVVAFLVFCVAATVVLAFAAAAVLAATTRCGLWLLRGGAGLSSATVNVGDWRLRCCWSDVSLETAKGLGAPLGVDEKTSVNGYVLLSATFFFTFLKK
jgi:hypothetical protein